MKKLVKYQIIISLIILAVYWISSFLTKNPRLAASTAALAGAVLFALAGVLVALFAYQLPQYQKYSWFWLHQPYRQ